jgi:phosphate transport system substrate-binding protein
MRKFFANRKVLISVMMALLIVVMVPSMVFAYTSASPGPTGYTTASYTPTAFTTGGSYNLRVSGSTTVYPIVEHLLAHALSTDYADIVPEVKQGGSGQGAKDCGVGWSDIAMASSLSDYGGTNSYNDPMFNSTRIARDGIVIIVNTSVTNINQITFDDLAKIYNGTYHNWSELGGPNLVIKPYSRIIGSGTRASFMDFLKNYGGGLNDANEETTRAAAGTTRQLENSDMAGIVNGDPGTAGAGAIGYVGLGFVEGRENIRQLNISKTTANPSYVEPTTANVYSQSYPMSRWLYVCTLNHYTSDNAANAADFITCLQSESGQDSVKAADFLKLYIDPDVNKNGVINVSDVASVGAYWGQGGAPHWVSADVNSNGVVNVSDVSAVGAWWSFGYPAP